MTRDWFRALPLFGEVSTSTLMPPKQRVSADERARERFGKHKMMVFPRDVLIGHGVIDEVAGLCDDLELGKGALLLSSGTTHKVAGERVAKLLASAGYTVSVCNVEEASVKEVKRAQAAAEKQKSDFLVGIGGGSTIDVAKLASFNLGLPFISVPTAASHDGITSGRASIRDSNGTFSKEAKPPVAIVADTEILTKAPFRMLAAGCGDILSNITAVLDWELAQRLRGEEYSSFAANMARTSAEMILENADIVKPGFEESAWLVMKSLLSSGVAMSVAGSSRPASGSEHLFSHMLDRLAPGKAMHGEQCGVGTVMMMYLHGGDWKTVQAALRTVGAPTTAKDLGIPKKVIIEALTKAHALRPDRYTILGDNGLTKEAAERLVSVTGVA